MREKTLIKIINKIIPEARPVPLAEFYGEGDLNESAEGIWFKGSEDIAKDEISIFEYHLDNETGGVHPKLNQILEEANWYWEPYDSGTLMAYRN